MSNENTMNDIGIFGIYDMKYSKNVDKQSNSKIENQKLHYKFN